MWIGAGVTLGATVVGGLASLLCLLDGGAAAADFVPLVAIIAGTLGAVGGGFAGTVCAALTCLLDRLTGGLPAAGYAAVAATVTSAVAGAVAFWLTQPGSLLTSDQLWAWILMPVAVSSAVAAAAGGYLWRHAFES
jgi:hypothetical protein